MSACPSEGQVAVGVQPESIDVVAESAAASVLSASMLRLEGGTPASDNPQQEVVLRYEDRAEEWHFDEATHMARILEHRELAKGFKEREQQAKQRHKLDVEEQEQRIAEIFKSAEDEEQRLALELAGLREQLVDAQHQVEELEEECEQQVRACERQILEERAKCTVLEEELQKEKESVHRATLEINAIEDRESQLMRLKRQTMSEDRAFCQRQMMEIQRNGDQEIREMGRALREEVDAIQKAMDTKMLETKNGVDTWVRRRREVTAAADQDIIETIDTKVFQSLTSVHIEAAEVRQASISQVLEIQASGYQQENLLRDKMNKSMASVSCSNQERDKVATPLARAGMRLLSDNQRLPVT